MKSLKIYGLILMALLFVGSTALMAQSARVQIIHNSADAEAEVVDVWLNETKLIENFSFRTATPFIDAPAGVLLNIGIAPPNSSSWTQSFRIKQVALTAGETYVIVASGIISTSGYNPSPTFKVSVYPVGREAASQPENTDVLVIHGSTDAPTVDIYETGVGAGQIVNDLVYENVAGYLELPTMNYVLEIRDETGQNTVAAYDAPLASLDLEGNAITVLASGFLNPGNNSNGPAFGLWAALTTGGDLIELPASVTQPVARVQVIHNAADAAAEVVDVWLNDTKLIEDFAFRTASPFIDAPAGVEFTIAIQAPGSTSPENPIWSQNYTLASDETYVLVANGIVSPSGYDPAIPFDIYVYDMGREEASMMNNTDILVHHGSTDAPTVDVVEVGVGYGTVVDDISYGEFDGYLELPTSDDYLLNLFEPQFGTFATYAAPLASLGLDGAAITIIASGFLNPENNSNGAEFGLWVALASGGELVELPFIPPTPLAYVQVIHNSADAAAAVVDVWLDDELLLDDFAFRTASFTYGLPAGETYTVSIKGPDSQNPDDPIWTMDYTLEEDKTYILVAEGIVSQNGYNPPTPFDVYVYDMGRVLANNPENTDVLVHHGSTDAPTVDVYETGVGAGEIVNDLMYGDFAGYLELGTLDYVLEIRDETGMNTVAAYDAPLSTLGLDGAAITVIASGFLNPENNSNGPAFGLWVALPFGGPLLELPAYTAPSARVQVIHNAADAAAEVVDVWLNDTKLIEGFAFRTATPFIDAPAGVEFTIAIQGPGSTSPENPIWSQNYTLAGGEKYVLVANGLVDTENYEPFQGFDIYVFAMGREEASNASNTDILVFHGSTDAPVVDVVEVGVGAGTIVDDLSYGDFAGYLELPTADYAIQIRNAAGTDVVAQYAAPLATLMLDGVALSVIASGFLNPANNNNGPAFGLFVASPLGGELIALPMVDVSTARVQVIHNAADAAAEVVDVWLNDTKLIEGFAFRTATPFIDAPAAVEFTIAIQGPGSTSPENPIWSQNYTLAGGEKYVLVANGLVDTENYEPFQAFDIYVYPMGREEASSSSNTDVLVFHGSTDAPVVDVVEIGLGAGTIIDNLAYGDFAGYLELPTEDYTLDIRDETGTVTVASYAAPLATLALDGAALSVVASGFLNPGNNNNGPSFGLYVALASGGDLIPLPVVTSIEETNNKPAMNIYPNPAVEVLNIDLQLKNTSPVTIEIFNLLGSKVFEQNLGTLGAGNYNNRINLNNLTEGIYLMRVTTANSPLTQKIKITR